MSKQIKNKEQLKEIDFSTQKNLREDFNNCEFVNCIFSDLSNVNFIDCDFYNITYISTSDKLAVNNDIVNFGILLKRITEVIYFNFNNELYQFDNVKCLKPKGVINYCYPNTDKLNKYSILDFTKSTELIDIGKNYHQCVKINYC